MTTKEAITILTEMQKWCRAEGKYTDPCADTPYDAATFGKAIDFTINKLK